MNTYQTSLTLSQKGQIALPVAVRRLLKLEPKSQLILEWTDSGSLVLKKPESSIEQVVGSLPFNTANTEITKERITKAQAMHYQKKKNNV